MLSADLHTMLADNARACVTPRTRSILNDLDRQARKLLRKIADDERTAKVGYDTRLSILSIYGGEAAVRDIIRQAAFHRKHGAVPAKRRAA